MIVLMNEKEIEIFSGARVGDALLKYSKEEYRAVSRGKKQVTDKWGNPHQLDGELTDEQHLYIGNL
jgi:hypothetical protein